MDEKNIQIKIKQKGNGMKFNINEWVEKQAKLNEVRGPIKTVETRIKKGSKFDMDELRDDYGFYKNVDGVDVEKLFRNGVALRDMSIVYDQRGDMYLMDTKDIPKYH
tara:strand:+ start:196 stop:516 length:321 start_codon:yes stop_codon:yes gene_type:complete